MTHSDAVRASLRKFKGGLSDYGIFHAVKAIQTERRATPSSIRTRRAELVAAGIVKDSGKVETSSTGRKAVIWQLA